ncbi:hypothetical protein ASG88_19615 [Nocardioides sp. Soil777]|uniref:M56 family metallopeptidase n=1 Tax=Nocardioides sp. Soil777 TaxID=1736409 RepID=UPI0007024E90|nr:M56 family metallopeptidase [Nocardioides sp. Soil777]KRF06714.1 hypothetical protein ASG88_19615 [Nocardioides sp. Soil777]
MTAPLVLAVFALATAILAPRYLVAAQWVLRSPSGGILAWQAVSAAVASSAILIGLTLALPILPVGPQLTSLVRTTHLDVTDHYATPAGNGLASLALLAAAAMTLRVILALAVTLRRASRERRAQLQALRLVGSPSPEGYTVIDHAMPLVYCLPGRHRTVVVTSAALVALTPAELASVLAHERGHLRARHDLALTVSSALARAFAGVAVFRTAHHQIGMLAEMQADDSAQNRLSRRAMATALVTLGASGAAPPRPTRAGTTPAGSVPSRVGRLVGTQGRVLPRHRAAVGLGVLALLAAPLALALSPALEASARDCCHVALPSEPLKR